MTRATGIAVGAIGTAGAALVVAGVARYGYATSDTALDGWFWATWFGLIALAALAGPALAGHLRRETGAAWSVACWMLVAAALVLNCSNSLGAIAARGDKTAADRTKARDSVAAAQGELERIARERSKLPAFAPATIDDVVAAREAITAVARDRMAECGANNEKRGTRCREREGAEQSKRETLADILARKALTERAARFDAGAESARSRIADLPSVKSINPQAKALARLLRMSDSEAAAAIQQASIVAFVELLIAFMLAAAERLVAGAKPPLSASVPNNSSVIGASQNCVAAPVALQIEAAKLGGIKPFVATCISRAEGGSVAVREIYDRYVRWCAEHGAAPMDARMFAQRFKALCERHGAMTEFRGGSVYCVNVRLAA